MRMTSANNLSVVSEKVGRCLGQHFARSFRPNERQQRRAPPGAIDTFFAQRDEKLMPRIPIRGSFDGDPRRQFHASGKIGLRWAIERQTSHEGRVGKEKVGYRPFTQNVVAEHHAIIS